MINIDFCASVHARYPNQLVGKACTLIAVALGKRPAVSPTLPP
jgi:hypothetical protein